jgi:glycosyltransferase involved in cell wall biosynthesis
VPRVAIAVPVHDAEPFLEQALASILAQTYTSWEAIVVDDASTDASPEIAAAFARQHPHRIRAIRLGRNVGVAAARNAAIRAARRGDLVALLDHDDAWRSDYLARSVALFDGALAAGRRPGIVACNAWLHTPHGILPETFAERFGWIDPIDYDAMIERNCVLARALFSREAFEVVGGFAPECLAADDYDLWLRILEVGYEVITTPEPLVVYRLHAGAQSRDRRLMAESKLVTYRRALRRGALSPGQRRAVHFQMRHHRALRERAIVYAALADRRPLRAAAVAMRAAPYGLISFLQAPGRWREWMLPARRGVRAGSPARRPRRPGGTRPRRRGSRPASS